MRRDECIKEYVKSDSPVTWNPNVAAGSSREVLQLLKELEYLPSILVAAAELGAGDDISGESSQVGSDLHLIVAGPDSIAQRCDESISAVHHVPNTSLVIMPSYFFVETDSCRLSKTMRRMFVVICVPLACLP